MIEEGRKVGGRHCSTEGMMISILWLCSMICRNIFQIFFGCQEKYLTESYRKHKYKKDIKLIRVFFTVAAAK
jgi:hypothetical protein